MFDRETAIAAWRQRLVRTGNFFESDLDELEEHVRDHLDALEEVGLAGEAAFRIALESLGEAAALGDEFAKVNRLAWRAPLFWIAMGCFAVALGTPCLRAGATALAHAGVALHVPAAAMRALMWGATLGVPLAFFAALFRRVGRPWVAPLSWAESPSRRIGLLVACAVVVLVAMVGAYVVGMSSASPGDPALESADRARWAAYSMMGHVAPFAVGAFALGLRLGTPRGERERTSPAFWLALGCLVAFGGAELAEIMRVAAFAGGGAVHFGPSGMRALVWIVTLATPAIALACGTAWLRRHSPTPGEFLRGRGAVAAALALCALPIASPLASMPLAVRAYYSLGGGLMLESARAGVQASFVVMPLLVVALGALMLHCRGAARSAL